MERDALLVYRLDALHFVMRIDATYHRKISRVLPCNPLADTSDKGQVGNTFRQCFKSGKYLSPCESVGTSQGQEENFLPLLRKQKSSKVSLLAGFNLPETLNFFQFRPINFFGYLGLQLLFCSIYKHSKKISIRPPKLKQGESERRGVLALSHQ